MRSHQKRLEGLQVISNLSAAEEKVSSHPCGICCRNFSSASVSIARIIST